jgi:branched-chain amino acid transport system permease protein
MATIIQLLVASVLLGGVYALVSIGLTLIFGVMRVVNFAHGEFLMLGMYLAFWGFSLWNVDPYLAVVVALPGFFLLGGLTYLVVMRGIIGSSHSVQIFTTVGLSIALQSVALLAWTSDFRFVRPPLADVTLRVAGASINLAALVAFAVAMACTLGLFAFLRWTHLGMVVRATAQDREAATLMGINTDLVNGLTFALGIACAGVAGVLLAPRYPVYPTAGLQFILIAFVVVVLGGLGDMVGALVGSLIVAAVEVFGSYVIGTAWREVLYFLILLAVLLFRPAGLFGQRGAETLGT